MPEIQSERKPRQRLARRLNMRVSLSSACRRVGRGGRVVQPGRFADDLGHLRLPEELQYLLHLKLLVVADLNHTLQLRDALLHDGADVSDLLFVLLDPRVRFLHQLLVVGRAVADVAVERLYLLDAGLDDLLDGHAERLQRGFDDLLLHARVRARGQTPQQVDGAGDAAALLRVHAGGVEDGLEIDPPARGRGGRGLEYVLRGGRVRVRFGRRRGRGPARPVDERLGLFGAHLGARLAARALFAFDEPAGDGRTPTLFPSHGLPPTPPRPARRRPTRPSTRPATSRKSRRS